MSYVKPAVARHTTDYFSNQLTITIHSHKQWLQLPFLIFWLMGWTLGETAAINDIAHQGMSGEGLFLLIWIAAWTVGGALALLTLLWILLGCETIAVNGRFLIHRRQILGVGLTKQYEIAHIRDLRPALQPLSRSRQWPRWGIYSVIAFDYGAKTVRIGNSIDEAEAKQIVRTLSKYMVV